MKPDLSTFEILMIRAIKGNKGTFRLKQIIAREFDLSVEYLEDFDLVSKLYKICEKYRPEKMGFDFIMDLHEEQDWRYTTVTNPKAITYFERIIQRCCSILRFTKGSDLPGYRKAKNYREFPYTLYRDHTEIEVTVTGYETDGLPAKYPSVSDDDSYPEEPGSFEIQSVYDDDGNFYELTEDEETEVIEENFNFE